LRALSIRASNPASLSYRMSVPERTSQLERRRKERGGTLGGSGKEDCLVKKVSNLNTPDVKPASRETAKNKKKPHTTGFLNRKK